MVNKVILVGRLGRDPEGRYLPDGTLTVSLSVATDENRKNKDGERQKKTEWHRVVAFGKLAEICEQYLSKGSLVYIEGSLQTRSWEGKDGNKRSTTEIVAKNMQMLDSKGKSSGRSDGSGESVPAGGDDVPF